MGLLNRAAVFGAKDLATRDVDVPEWGGAVRIRALTSRQRVVHQQELYRAKQGGGDDPFLHARVVVLGAVDADGKRLFSDDDVQEMATKCAGAVERLAAAIEELTFMTARSGEDAEKNSGSPAGSASSSASPDTCTEPSANCSTPATAPN